MAKLRLDLEEEDRLRLLGIQSNWSEQKLVWTMNRVLDLHLTRITDFSLDLSNESPSGLFDTPDQYYFSVYSYQGEEEHAILVANLGQGMALFDKKRKLDYLFKLESKLMDQSTVIDKLNAIRGVLAVTRLECSADDISARPFAEFI